MKVLLLNASQTEPDQRVALDKLTRVPPLHLGYLASVLEKHGSQVLLVDLTLAGDEGSDIARQAMRDFAPHLVGISSTTPSFPMALRLAELSKELLPTATVVMGGTHVTFTADDTLRQCPAVDIVVRGEGEATLKELVDCLQAGGSLDRVRGLSYRQNGEPAHNPPRPFIQDLDSIPWPARHLFDTPSYSPVGALISSRGCPGRCVFCAGGAMSGHRYRVRQPERVTDEIEYLCTEYGFKRLIILDDTFTGLPQKLTLPVCQEIERRRLHIAWACESRVDVATPKVLDALRRAGCDRIQFGVESGSPRILATLHKGITLDQVRQAIKHAISLGMQVWCSFILGHPDETQEDARQTIDLVHEIFQMGTQSVAIAFLVPFPGTEVYERREALGITLHETDWAKFTRLDRPIVSTKHLSRDQLRELYVDALLPIMLNVQNPSVPGESKP
jgi:anaerobic magnesium-protoporphyrin IX monomethyl ester cyclase